MPVVLFLADLAPLVMMVGSLIFILLCVAIIKALATSASGAVSWIPGVGGFLKVGIHAAEHKLVGVMTEWADKLDASIGWSLHQIAREIDWLGAEIKSHSNLLYTLGAITLGPGFAAATHAALKGLHIRLGGVAAIAASAVHRLELAEKRLAHSVAHGVYPRLRVAERAITHTIPKDIAGLRARTKAVEAELSNLWKAVRTRERIIVDTAFVGAIAVALSRLGLGNLRCPGFVKVLNRVGCGGFGLLGELFETAVAAFAVADICDFANVAQDVAQAFVPELMALVDLEDALVGCHGASRPPDLTLAAPNLPAPFRRLPLAA